MEAAPARDPALKVPPAKVLREPLSWAAAAAFFGAAVGLVGSVWQAQLLAALDFDLAAAISSGTLQTLGQTTALLSLLGVGALISGPRPDSRALRLALRLAPVAGTVLISISVAASALSLFFLWYSNTGEMRYETGPPPVIARASFWGSLYLAPVAVLSFALGVIVRRAWRTAAMLLGLCLLTLPVGIILWSLFPSTAPTSPEDLGAPALLGFLGWGVSLPEAPMWGLLGVQLLRAARDRSYGEAERLQAEENRERARRLYEEGLGRGDLSVVDDLVSEDFLDLRRGARGRLGMERAITALWASYPDLAVCVEGQEAEGDLVRTRLLLSGTDRGGVLWYPPTGRRATFPVEFVDRFSAGKVVEHSGTTDTGDLLRQLGLTEER